MSQREILFGGIVSEAFSDSDWLNNFRMSQAMFIYVCNELPGSIISVCHRLCLYMCVMNSSQQSKKVTEMRKT